MTDIKEYSDTLAHYGVPGMKWGKRRMATVAAARRTQGQASIDKAGSASKAVARVALRRVAVVAVGNVALRAISQIPDPSVRAGANAIVKLANLGMIGVDVSSLASIGMANAANKKE